jgi:hypothetical protein
MAKTKPSLELHHPVTIDDRNDTLTESSSDAGSKAVPREEVESAP